MLLERFEVGVVGLGYQVVRASGFILVGVCIHEPAWRFGNIGYLKAQPRALRFFFCSLYCTASMTLR